jgi:ankyrin repeat protein
MMIFGFIFGILGVIAVIIIVSNFFRGKPKNIIEAVKKFRYDYMDDFLKNGGNINTKSNIGRTLLMIASDKGMKKAKGGRCMTAGGWKAIDNSNPGSYAATLRLMGFLLKKGADPNLKDKEGQTALFFAADSPDRVDLLLKYGADINAQNNDGETVMIRAAKISDYYIVKDFFEKGADPHIKDNGGKTAVQYAIEENHESIVEFFAEKGLDGSETGSEVMR